MKKKIEYAIASITTNKIVPKIFTTKEGAEMFKSYRPNSDHWKIVSREVIYGDWK